MLKIGEQQNQRRAGNDEETEGDSAKRAEHERAYGRRGSGRCQGFATEPKPARPTSPAIIPSR
jgi:hypothetical protein